MCVCVWGAGVGGGGGCGGGGGVGFNQFYSRGTSPLILIQLQTRASRRRAIVYPRASAIAYLRAHQNSKCVSPIIIHRAISCDSFKGLVQKAKRSCVTMKKKDPKFYFLTSSDTQTCPGANFFAPLYSTLHLLRFDMQHDYVCTKWILDPSGPHSLALPPPPFPQGLHQNSECVPPVLIHRAVTCDSFKGLAQKA